MGKIVDFIKGIIDGITSERIMFCFGGLLVVFFVVLLLVMFFDGAAKEVEKLLGTTSKKETIEFIGWAMSGAFVAIGLVALSRRAEAQIENNRLVERGHKQERFKTATEHLGHDNSSVRIAAFYEFLHLIKDSGEEYRKSILDILYAYMRTITDDFARREDVIDAEGKGEPIKLTEEIQGLLDILFKSQDIDRSDIKPNLQRVYFLGADLSHGDLSGADLSNANLSGAFLVNAKLPGADLSWAKLSKADLSEVDLSGANLSGAFLPKADLSRADLSGAFLLEADLSGAILFNADLSGANLFAANLSGADLFAASLSGAELPDANLSEAGLFEADLSGACLSRADFFGEGILDANLSKARLGGAFYTNKTIFPEWFVPPIVPPDNGDKVQFPEDFVAPEKPEDDE